MRIHFALSKYFDWAPCPPGTEITAADRAAGRVKQMSDDRWYMRVEFEARPGQHHDVGIHEESVCRRMAALCKLGRPKGRAQVVTEFLDASLHHHVDPAEHLEGVTVHDDGPNPYLFNAAFDEAGVSPEVKDRTRSSYEKSTDLQTFVAGYLGL